MPRVKRVHSDVTSQNVVPQTPQLVSGFNGDLPSFVSNELTTKELNVEDVKSTGGADPIVSISSLISIRNYLDGIVDALRVKLSREEVRAVQQKVVEMDKEIVRRSLELKFQ